MSGRSSGKRWLVALALRPELSIVAALLFGAAWHLGLLGIALSPGVVELWRRSQSRWHAAQVAAAYYASSSLGVLCAMKAPRHGDTSWFECLLWLLLSTSAVSSVWSLLWHPRGTRPTASFVRTAALMLSPVVPIYGALTVASPLTAAGAWFPGLGWGGLAALVIGISIPSPRARLLSAASAGLWGALMVPSSGAAHMRGVLAQGIDTHIHVTSERYDYAGQARTAIEAQAAVPPEATVTVLAEGLAGVWTDTMRSFWAPVTTRLRSEGRTLFVGATLPVDGPGGEAALDNGLVVLGRAGERFVRQRVPVPFVMWRPWAPRGSYRAHWLDNGIVELEGHRYAAILCYEHWLVLPVLLSAAAHAQTLIGSSNLQGFSSASLEHSQRAALGAWASLFSMQVVFANNS